MGNLKVFSLTIFFFVVLFGHSMAFSTESPILVGATVSLDGEYVETSAMIQLGYKMWAEEVNSRGGLLGRKIKLVFYDDKSKPELAREFYRKLIEEDGVELVLSPYGTPLTMAASEITEKHQKVMIACASAAPKPWERGYRYLFGIYALADRYFISFLDVIARKGFNEVAIVNEDSVFNNAIGNAAARWAERFGVKVVYHKRFKEGTVELPQIAQELKAKSLDEIIFSAYPPDSYSFINELKKLEYKPRSLGMTIVPTYPQFYEKVGSYAEGIFGISQWESDERIPFPGTRRFIANFQKFTGQVPSYHAGSAYAECQILEEAIRKANTIDHDKIRDYVSGLDAMTVIGRFKVDQTGRQIGHNPILIQWQNGRKEIVYPRKMKTKDPIFGVTISNDQ